MRILCLLPLVITVCECRRLSLLRRPSPALAPHIKPADVDFPAAAPTATRGGASVTKVSSERNILVPIVSVYNLWHRLPGIVKFGTAGTLGNVVFYHMDLAMKAFALPLCPPVISPVAPSLTFALAYMCQIPFQHFVNAIMVYRVSTILPAEKYKSTLVATYKLYSFAIVYTAVLRQLLGLVMNPVWSFIGATYGVGTLNFFLLGKAIGEKNE